MHQHTGNWTGKTVSNAVGKIKRKGKYYKFVDIPGTYSIMSNSEEEEIARNYICFGKPDVTVVVVDATNLERNLNLLLQILEVTNDVILCVNLLDEAKKKKIELDLVKLSNLLNIQVVGVIARKKKTLIKLINEIEKICKKEVKQNYEDIVKYDNEIENKINKYKEILIRKWNLNEKLARWVSIKIIDDDKKILKEIESCFKINIMEDDDINEIKNEYEENATENKITKEKITSSIINKAEDIAKQVCKFENKNYAERDRKIDKILTSKKYGIPIMLMFLMLIFWITMVGANYPSQFLFNVFDILQNKLIEFANYINCPEWLSNMLILGVYQTLTWVISVMLPPMAIFFPLFTILEDLGYLPRIAFNMDAFFKKACCSGKQMITMCMGFGCNACGVTGCRIIDSPRERLIAIITNNLVPCNRKISIFNNNSNYICCWNNAGNRRIYFIYNSRNNSYIIRNRNDIINIKDII